MESFSPQTGSLTEEALQPQTSPETLGQEQNLPVF